jgi:hypothetical protein
MKAMLAGKGRVPHASAEAGLVTCGAAITARDKGVVLTITRAAQARC